MAKTRIRNTQIVKHSITGAAMTPGIRIYDETAEYSAGETVFWGSSLYMVKSNHSVSGNNENDLSRSPDIDTENWLKLDILSTFIDVTYDELYELYDNENFIPGVYYRLTDYRTVFDVQEYPEFTTIYSDIEELILFAVSNSNLSNVAYSLEYPNDIIYYDIENNKTEELSADRPGFISYRKDIYQNISTNYDFRKVYFVRFGITAPDYVEGNDYSANTLVKYGGSIYYVYKDITNAPADIYTTTTIWLNLYEGDYICSFRDYSIPLPVGKPEYIDYNNKKYFNTFSDEYHTLSPSNKYFNCHITVPEGTLGDIVLFNQSDKFNPTTVSNVSIVDSTYITVRGKSINQLSILSSHFFAIYAPVPNPIIGMSFIKMTNGKVSFGENVSISNSRRFSLNACQNFRLTIGSYFVINEASISDIDDIYYTYIKEVLHNCTINRLYQTESNSGFDGIKALGDFIVKNYTQNQIKNLIINTVNLTVDFTSATIIFNEYSKFINKIEDGDTKLFYYDSLGNLVMVDLTT